MVMDKIPSPCFPGLPRADPSELSFIQPIGGLSHAIGITAFVLFNLDLVPMEKISALSLMHFVRTILSIIPILKMKLFWPSQRCQSPMGKRIFHGIPRWLEVVSELPFVSIHFLTKRQKELLRLWGTLRLCQNPWAMSHPRNRWSIDSLLFWHMVRIGLRFKPLEPRTSPIGRLLCTHNQIRNYIRRCVSIFHTQAMEGGTRFRGFKPLARRYAELREKKPSLEKA